MGEITLKINGETPLLMHNSRLANPLDPYTQAIGAKSGKRKKTLDDIAELARIEWEGGLYTYKNSIQLPARVVNKTFERGATKQKNGTRWKTGCVLAEDFFPLEYPGKIIFSESKEIPNDDLDALYDAHSHQDTVRVGSSRLLRTRPVFYEWGIAQIVILFDGNVINRDTIVESAIDAGKLCGMGDYRPEKGGQYGKFSVEVLK
jgi:hypothetical protein